MRITGLLTGGAAALLVAACATPPRAPAVAPASALPQSAPADSSPAPALPPAPLGWEDLDLTPGDWRFAPVPAPEAKYGEGAAAAFAMRCDLAQRRVLLVRPDARSSLTIRTTFGPRELPTGEGGIAALPASDPFLDDIVSSRGRFAVEAADRPALILPTWPEPARVVEECRS